MFFSIRNQFCPNSHCSYFEQPLSGNVTVHSRKQQRFRCKSCGVTWVMHRQDRQYGLRTERMTVDRAVGLMQEGFSVRRIARAVSVSPSTVQRWKTRFS